MTKRLLVLWSLLLLVFSLSFAYPAGDETPHHDDHLTLTFVGDIMVHGIQLKSTFDSKFNDHRFHQWFRYVLEPLSSSDYTIGNLETTLTNRPDHYMGYPVFKSPESLLDGLKAVGFDLLMTANNHSLDNGIWGVEHTIKTLKNKGIQWTGTSMRGQPPEPIIINEKGFRLGLISLTYGTNGFSLPPDAPYSVNLLQKERVKALIKPLLDQALDGIIVYVHWGNEYQRYPSGYQKEWAKYLAESGADWIIGSHPHVIQPEGYIATKRGRTYVNYSLGNFVSNQQWRYSDTGLALTLKLERYKGQLITHLSHLPIWVDKYTENGQVDFALIPLLSPPKLARLSESDLRLMEEALSDFYELYPHIETN